MPPAFRVNPCSPKTSPEARLLAGLAAMKLDLALAEPLLAYLGQLVRWNSAYNLTSVRDPSEMITRHVLDSLVTLPFVRGLRLIDIGAGAGLPGIPLAMVKPELHVSLLDSNGKKARFLSHAQRTLGLKNVEVVEQRAEGYAPAERFSGVIARAFGSLGEFLGATSHLGTADGQWLAMKGKLDPKELKDIPPEFQIVEVKPLLVPGLNETRHLIVVSRQ